MRLSSTPIKRKLRTVILLTCGVVLVLTSSAFIAYELFTYRQSILDNLRIVARVTADNAVSALGFGVERDAEDVLSALRADQQIEVAAFYDTDGNLFATYPENQPSSSYPPVITNEKQFVKEGYVHLYQPVIHDGTYYGMLYLRSNMNALWRRAQLYIGIVLAVMATSIIVAAGLSSILQRSILNPILALAGTARVISERRDYSVRARKLSNDELGLLTDAFNHMLAQIHERDVALSENAERLRLALEASRTGTWDWNFVTNKLTWGPSLHDLYGLSPGEFQETFEHFLSLVHPDDRQSVRTELHRAIDQKTDYSGEFRIVRADASIRYLSSRGKAFYDDSGRPLRMTGVAMDVTSRHQAEQALRESEGLLRAVVETAADGIITIEENGNIRTLNPAAETIFGYRQSEVAGQPVSHLIPGLLPKNLLLHGHDSEEHGRQLAMAGHEVIGRRRDGSPFAVELAISETEVRGVSIFTGIVRDITERKRAEEEIRRLNAELEQRVLDRTAELALTNQELEAFTYSVSHDLRAPLRHIDAYARILEDEYAAELSGEALRYFDRIRHCTQNMGRLVDDLLNLAKLGRQDLAWQRADIRAMVEQVIEDLRPEIGNRKVEWHIGLLPSVECDPGLVRLIFANLISNAIKYSRTRDKAIIEIGVHQDGSEQVFYVRDNGVGFNMKYAHKLFGVFQRLHRPDEFEGTGVGLATVDRIVRKHGGRVWAEAELDKGAVFYFTLGTVSIRSPEAGRITENEQV